jgi:hypothetical protein
MAVSSIPAAICQIPAGLLVDSVRAKRLFASINDHLPNVPRTGPNETLGILCLTYSGTNGVFPQPFFSKLCFSDFGPDNVTVNAVQPDPG